MSSTALEFGLINTFRTQNVLLDTLMCMLVPLVIQRITARMETSHTTLWSFLVALFAPKTPSTTVTRHIDVEQRFNSWGKVHNDGQTNEILQKAISLYLGETVNLKGKNAQYELLEKPKKPKTSTGDGDASDCGGSATTCSSDDEDGDDYDYEMGVYRGEIETLAPNVLPPMAQWVVVADGVEFKHEIETPNTDGGDGDGKIKTSVSKISFQFRSTRPDGSRLIDALITKAFQQYQAAERLKYKQDKARYFYIQSSDTPKSSDDASAGTAVAYKRYALGEAKTFENLFFAEKEAVVQLVDNFIHKTGKFAIKGFPYKLGLLLHGPPGTGKTSLIKAVAQHTKRHIVTINLSKIKTNQQLMDAVFDLKFAVAGHDLPIKYTFKDVVFVMEDIDCASSVVNARASSDRDYDDDGATKKKKTKAERMRESQKKAEANDDDDDLPELIGPAMKPSSTKSNDRLNLSGLLNVLDGVIDCPGRIVIMTTNHPEKLDPALIRPGRVNKKLLLSHMGGREVQQMIEYFCLTTLREEQRLALERALTRAGKAFTPAEIEEFCAEYDDAESVVRAIASVGEHEPMAPFA